MTSNFALHSKILTLCPHQQNVVSTSLSLGTTITTTTTTVTATRLIGVRLTSTLMQTLTFTAVPRAFAACNASTNILGPQTPKGFIEGINDLDSLAVVQQTSAIDCCIQCHLEYNCAGSFYSVGSLDPNNGKCILVKTRGCKSQAGFGRRWSPLPSHFRRLKNT